jgi:hypothetical protein
LHRLSGSQGFVLIRLRRFVLISLRGFGASCGFPPNTLLNRRLIWRRISVRSALGRSNFRIIANCIPATEQLVLPVAARL